MAYAVIAVATVLAATALTVAEYAQCQDPRGMLALYAVHKQERVCRNEGVA